MKNLNVNNVNINSEEYINTAEAAVMMAWIGRSNRSVWHNMEK